MHIEYEIMHADCCVASIDTVGRCKVHHAAFMPYSLRLKAGEEFDTCIENLDLFHHWCASRILTLDRQNAKAMLNSAGMTQAETDRDRARNALQYRCLSMKDVFWIRKKDERISFADVNLYQNHLETSCVDIALSGNQYAVSVMDLARDLSTDGCCAKAWRHNGTHLELIKGGSDDAANRELLASRICRCFDVNQVLYEGNTIDGKRVTISKGMTSIQYGLVDMREVYQWMSGNEEEVKAFILDLDAKNYHMMNIVDYLVGNTDRHLGNWGVLVDNAVNRPLRLHDLMDFDQAFCAYDTLEGAECQTLFVECRTQKEAALQAVEKIGLNQIESVPSSVFAQLPQYEEMFRRRLAVLTEHCRC